MSVVFLTGTHPRHLFVARALASTGQLRALVLETREEHVPEPPPALDESTRSLFRRHFATRAAAEARFFGAPPGEDPLNAVPTIRITAEELNGPRTWEVLARYVPRLMLSYGVHKLHPETLAHAPEHRWNIHGGLSPWYRGVITHFWPSYLLEPQMTGMTLHATTEAIDGGAIVHQTRAPMVRGDGVHDVACRAVTAFAEELPELLTRMIENRLIPPRVQSTTGRIWREVDWRPAHLRVLYETYGDHVVDRYLDGELGGAAPKLVRQFEER